MTDGLLAEAKRINDICHQNNTAFILATIRGVFGQVFCDFGTDFTVFDTDGTVLARLSNSFTSSLPLGDSKIFNNCQALVEVMWSQNYMALALACPQWSMRNSTHARVLGLAFGKCKGKAVKLNDV